MSYSLSMPQQISSFFLALGLGFISAVVYYAVMLLRKAISQNGTVIFIFDILFGVIFSFMYFVFVTVFANGEFRPDILLSTVVGFFVFVKVLGRQAEKLSDGVAFAFRRLVRLLLSPIRFTAKFVKKTFKKVKAKASLVKAKQKKKPKKKSEKNTKNNKKDRKGRKIKEKSAKKFSKIVNRS